MCAGSSRARSPLERPCSLARAKTIARRSFAASTRSTSSSSSRWASTAKRSRADSGSITPAPRRIGRLTRHPIDARSPWTSAVHARGGERAAGQAHAPGGPPPRLLAHHPNASSCRDRRRPVRRGRAAREAVRLKEVDLRRHVTRLAVRELLGQQDPPEGLGPKPGAALADEVLLLDPGEVVLPLAPAGGHELTARAAALARVLEHLDHGLTARHAAALTG